MENNIKAALDTIQTTQSMKRKAKAHIRRKTFDYGRNLPQLHQHHRRLVSSFAALALILSGAGLWFTPLSAIGLDINPSLELQVNALDRVICLKGINEDGRAVAEKLKLAGMPYDKAMTRILISDEMAPYLEQGKLISIAMVGGGSHAHAEQMLNKVVCRTYALADEDTVYYCQVDAATVRAAREAGLSVARYLAWQQLKQSHPEAAAEEVLALDTRVIRDLAGFTELENPCGE